MKIIVAHTICELKVIVVSCKGIMREPFSYMYMYMYMSSAQALPYMYRRYIHVHVHFVCICTHLTDSQHIQVNEKSFDLKEGI